MVVIVAAIWQHSKAAGQVCKAVTVTRVERLRGGREVYCTRDFITVTPPASGGK